MASQPVVLSVPGHAELHLSTSSGRLRVTAEDRADVRIEAGAPREERIERDAKSGETYGKFVVKPLERGFGITNLP